MMLSFMKDFDHLKIQMKDIVSATNNFDPTTLIGRGGFGRVYKGELSSPEGQIAVAFKQLDRNLGQGNIEFWKEIMMLSKYKHENLISLLHFCTEGDEMVLVYEYASHESLDRHLTDASTLTWIKRLKICVGAACGLKFLHDPKGSSQRVLHRDIKSANILLDDNWTAKVSDFGLSKVGPANQPHSYLVSHAVGTPGYCDPLYMELGFLSKESDVYSFGVVLFEILCGRLCYEYCNRDLTKIFVPEWRLCYEQERLDEIILSGLKETMDPGSLKSFSAIAYQCVKKAREERPTMAEIVEELEFSLQQQETFENTPESSHKESSSLMMLFGQTDQSRFEDRHDDQYSQPPVNKGPIGFSLRDLGRATNNFSDDQKLGDRRFKCVYKGCLHDGTMVAVKEISTYKQDLNEHMNELEIISTVRHPNLVPLLGWCKTRLLLVYEFMPNGSLDYHLFNKKNILQWDVRYNIATGLASALRSLHEDWQRCVLHRNIKPSNIMLDSSFNAKLGDFGILQHMNRELVLNTSGLPRTLGYMAPEYEITRRPSTESDVYSFGVVALEIACGKKATDKVVDDPNSDIGLVEWVWGLLERNELLSGVDRLLKKEFNATEVQRLMKLGLWCSHPDQRLRPSMRQAFQVLKFQAALPFILKRKSLFSQSGIFTLKNK